MTERDRLLSLSNTLTAVADGLALICSLLYQRDMGKAYCMDKLDDLLDIRKVLMEIREDLSEG